MAGLLVAGITLAVVGIPLVIYRLRLVLDPKRSRPLRQNRRDADQPTHLLIVLGSGGHTAEMIAMLERSVTEKEDTRRLDWRDYNHRTWVVGAGDNISAQRAQELEKIAISFAAKNRNAKEVSEIGAGKSVIVAVPRARAIHQSVFTAPLTSLRCMLACCMVLLNPRIDFPDLILCNGPATATILVFTTIMLRFFNVRGCNSKGKMRTIYIESWARVKKLSLSGTLLSRIVDRFLVQWPQLESVVGRAEYFGLLV